MRTAFIIIVLLFIQSCHAPKLTGSRGPEDTRIGHYGRSVYGSQNEIILSGSASYAEFNFTGDFCSFFLKNSSGDTSDYNFVSIEVDGQYVDRWKVAGTVPARYVIQATNSNSVHLARIYKATEAQNGEVALSQLSGNIRKAEHPVRKKIEFIGDSHTAAFGCDTKEIPCGTNKWYDQHNAYWSYAPRVARALNADFMLSAVSGIGMYRNWNSTYPVMPQVYEATYMKPGNDQPRWDFSSYIPDVVSICLGTNDFSDGDGKTQRPPFDSAAYSKNYIDFIGTIYSHYPSAKIALLSSCTVAGEKADLLFACLQNIQSRARLLYPGKPVPEIFRLRVMAPKGCSYHPDRDDHADLAGQLEPFFRKMLQ